MTRINGNREARNGRVISKEGSRHASQHGRREGCGSTGQCGQESLGAGFAPPGGCLGAGCLVRRDRGDAGRDSQLRVRRPRAAHAHRILRWQAGDLPARPSGQSHSGRQRHAVRVSLPRSPFRRAARRDRMRSAGDLRPVRLRPTTSTRRPTRAFQDSSSSTPARRSAPRSRAGETVPTTTACEPASTTTAAPTGPDRTA